MNYPITSFDIIELAGGVPALHPERKGQLNLSPLKNWVEKNGGLPTYINSFATAILRQNPGWSISRVIATAVSQVKKICATGISNVGKVSAAVKAAACAAIAAWNKKKASASNDLIDDLIIEASDPTSVAYQQASLRKSYRANSRSIPEVLELSDSEYFMYGIDETLRLSDDEWKGVDELDNFEMLEQVMELSVAAQSAIRFPINLSEATQLSGKRYKKEILRVGEIVVDGNGRKFNFTADFLKGLQANFGKALDYVPLLYTRDDSSHTATSDASKYAGTCVALSVDDEENPQKLFGEFDLTSDAMKVVEHNPKFGVSVTAHPNYVDGPRNEYYGPMLLNVAATHMPKMTKMDPWEKVSVMASDKVERDFEVIDLSDAMYVNNEPVKEMRNMAKEETVTTEAPASTEVLNLSDEQIQAIANSPAFQAVVDKKTEALELSNKTLQDQLNAQKEASYQTLVKAAVNTFRNNGEDSVPPVLCDLGETLLLSFSPAEQDETIELSTGIGDAAKTEKVSRVELVTKMLEESKGFMNLGKERGSAEEDAVELSNDVKSASVNHLVQLANGIQG